MTLKLLKFPDQHVADIPGGLRRLADNIESGQYKDVNAVAWVMDTDGEIELGLIGGVSEAGPVAYLLFGCAQRKLEP